MRGHAGLVAHAAGVGHAVLVGADGADGHRQRATARGFDGAGAACAHRGAVAAAVAAAFGSLVDEDDAAVSAAGAGLAGVGLQGGDVGVPGHLGLDALGRRGHAVAQRRKTSSTTSRASRWPRRSPYLVQVQPVGVPGLKRISVRKKYSSRPTGSPRASRAITAGRAVAQTVAAHLDQAAVVGADDVVGREVEHAVGARDLPVDAAFDDACRSAPARPPCRRPSGT